MPHEGGVPRTFRAVMQRLGLARIKNSPAQRVKKAAERRVQQEAEAAESAPLGSSSIHGPRTYQAANASPVPPDPNTHASAAEALLMLLHTPNSVSERLRIKSREAMKQATEKATKLLELAVDGTAHSSASAYWTRTSAEAEVAYGKFQKALQNSRRNYYSRMPFDERWDDIQRSLAVLGRISTGNTVTAFRDSGAAFLHMWEAVDSAENEVLWQTYICKDDFVGRSTVHKMAVARQKRQCHTELLYDCGGNISGRTRLTEELKQSGATVIRYRPFFQSTFEYVFKGLDWQISPGLRNHRKILLVDGRVGFCGGLNVGNEYCGPQAGGTGKFRDTHCSVVGPAVAHLREVYNDTKEPRPWKYSWARWRQIATTQLSRQYESGRCAVEANVLKPLQHTTTEVRRRSGIYFRSQLRKASTETNRVLRPLRGKQLAAHVRRHNQQQQQAAQDASAPSPVPCGGPTPSATPSSSRTPTAATEVVAPLTATAPQAAADGKDTSTYAGLPESESAAAALGAVGPSGQGSEERKKSVMRRKVMEARVRALRNATDLPHKRSYTAILQQLPITDDEPVPEAELYVNRRSATTQILSCNPRYRDYSIQYAFWQVTRKCHRRLWITTPYYLPTRKLFRALLHAASRGVDVRILSGSNQTTDPWFMWHASNYITGRLLRAGVRIYEYKGTQIMHAKTVVADSLWSSIGSYNWDLMSNKNLEVCLCHLDMTTAREMEQHFLQDLALSEEVKLENHRQRSRWLRFTSWAFYNFVFLLDRITFRAFSNEDLIDSPGNFRD